MACTKSGKVVGWQLLQAAFGESQSTPCILHGVDGPAQKSQPDGKAVTGGGLNGFSKKGESQSASVAKPLPERHSSSSSLEGAKAGRNPKGLPPTTSVSK